MLKQDCNVPGKSSKLRVGSTVLYCIILYNTVHCTVLYCTVLCKWGWGSWLLMLRLLFVTSNKKCYKLLCIALKYKLHFTIQYNTVQYTIVQYNIVHYNKVQYSTVHYITAYITHIPFLSILVFSSWVTFSVSHCKTKLKVSTI